MNGNGRDPHLSELDSLIQEVERGKLEPSDISLAGVMQTWIGYLGSSEWSNLDLAGVFFALAARLVVLKIRMLLPSPHIEDEEPYVEFDPAQLQLIAEMGHKLGEFEDAESRFGLCGIEDDSSAMEETWSDLDFLPALLRTAGRLFLAMEPRAGRTILRESITPEEAIARVMTILSGGRRGLEEVLYRANSTMEMLSHFLALLEIIRLGWCIVGGDDSEVWLELAEREMPVHGGKSDV